jgi:hypothetical protein
MLVLDMIEILPPLGKYKYDTRRILPVKCYINNSMHLWSYIGNINSYSKRASREDSGSYHHAKHSLGLDKMWWEKKDELDGRERDLVL